MLYEKCEQFVSGGQLSAYRCEYVGKKICALLRMSD